MRRGRAAGGGGVCAGERSPAPAARPAAPDFRVRAANAVFDSYAFVVLLHATHGLCRFAMYALCTEKEWRQGRGVGGIEGVWERRREGGREGGRRGDRDRDRDRDPQEARKSDYVLWRKRRDGSRTRGKDRGRQTGREPDRASKASGRRWTRLRA